MRYQGVKDNFLTSEEIKKAEDSTTQFVETAKLSWDSQVFLA